MAKDLDLARGIVQVDKHAAVADRAYSSGDADALAGLRTRRQRYMAGLECRRLVGTGEFVGVGIDPECF